MKTQLKCSPVLPAAITITRMGQLGTRTILAPTIMAPRASSQAATTPTSMPHEDTLQDHTW